MAINKNRRDAIFKGAALAAAVMTLPTSGSPQQTAGSGNSVPASDAMKAKLDAIASQAKTRIATIGQIRGSKRLPPTPLLINLEGTKLSPRAANFDDITKTAVKLYGLNTKVPGQVSFRPKNVEEDFKFVWKTEDETFRFQHAEALLDQSADLLERGLAQRAEWNDLMVKAFNVAMDLQEFFDLDSIHQEETKAGFYTHDAIEASNLFSSEDTNDSSLRFQAAIVQSIQNSYYNIDNINAQSGFSQLLAIISHLTGQQFTWNGVTKVVQEHAQDAAFGLSTNSLFYRTLL